MKARGSILAILLLCPLVASGGSDGDADPCLAREAVQSYIGALRSRVLDYWVIPGSPPRKAEVVMRFTLTPSGDASQPEVVSAVDDQVAASARVAFSAARPFPALHGEAACLAGRSVKATFRLERDGPTLRQQMMVMWLPFLLLMGGWYAVYRWFRRRASPPVSP